jgi:catechol 2,3-dioxygenase-like lactoylglutathione lyase family enzyme
MAKQREPMVKLPPVEQVGIVVKDIDGAMEYYSSTFGWGPFHVMQLPMKGAIYRGKPGDCILKLAFTHSGPIEIELIQVLEGETPHTEFLRERGEGLQHLRFRVDDINDTLAELAKEGIEPVFQHSYPEIGISFAYLNTDKIGGVMIELIEMKKREGEEKDAVEEVTGLI